VQTSRDGGQPDISLICDGAETQIGRLLRAGIDCVPIKRAAIWLIWKSADL
jgi:hypothetical protein